MTYQNQNVATELLKRLDALWSKAHDIWNSFYYDYDRGYEELENEPFECEVSAARIRIGEEGNKISIDYSAVHVYDLCTNYCGPYDDEDVNVDEAYKNCEELCLEEAENWFEHVFNVFQLGYRRGEVADAASGDATRPPM